MLPEENLNTTGTISSIINPAIGLGEKEEENNSNYLFRSPGTSPVSKADRIRERAFRNRIHNPNSKYLKPYLKG